MRILIIEDEPKIAVISSRLKKKNYVVDISKNRRRTRQRTNKHI